MFPERCRRSDCSALRGGGASLENKTRITPSLGGPALRVPRRPRPPPGTQRRALGSAPLEAPRRGQEAPGDGAERRRMGRRLPRLAGAGKWASGAGRRCERPPWRWGPAPATACGGWRRAAGGGGPRPGPGPGRRGGSRGAAGARCRQRCGGGAAGPRTPRRTPRCPASSATATVGAPGLRRVPVPVSPAGCGQRCPQERPEPQGYRAASVPFARSPGDRRPHRKGFVRFFQVFWFGRGTAQCTLCLSTARSLFVFSFQRCGKDKAGADRRACDSGSGQRGPGRVVVCEELWLHNKPGRLREHLLSIVYVACSLVGVVGLRADTIKAGKRPSSL